MTAPSFYAPEQAQAPGPRRTPDLTTWLVVAAAMAAAYGLSYWAGMASDDFAQANSRNVALTGAQCFALVAVSGAVAYGAWALRPVRETSALPMLALAFLPVLLVGPIALGVAWELADGTIPLALVTFAASVLLLHVAALRSEVTGFTASVAVAWVFFGGFCAFAAADSLAYPSHARDYPDSEFGNGLATYLGMLGFLSALGAIAVIGLLVLAVQHRLARRRRDAAGAYASG